MPQSVLSYFHQCPNKRFRKRAYFLVIAAHAGGAKASAVAVINTIKLYT